MTPAPHQGDQAEPLLLDEAGKVALQLEVTEHLEGPLCHLQGVGQTQDPPIRLALLGERMEAMAGQMGLDGRHCLLKVSLRQHLSSMRAI